MTSGCCANGRQTLRSSQGPPIDHEMTALARSVPEAVLVFGLFVSLAITAVIGLGDIMPWAAVLPASGGVLFGAALILRRRGDGHQRDACDSTGDRALRRSRKLTRALIVLLLPWVAGIGGSAAAEAASRSAEHAFIYYLPFCVACIGAVFAILVFAGDAADNEQLNVAERKRWMWALLFVWPAAIPYWRRFGR